MKKQPKTLTRSVPQGNALQRCAAQFVMPYRNAAPHPPPNAAHNNSLAIKRSSPRKIPAVTHDRDFLLLFCAVFLHCITRCSRMQSHEALSKQDIVSGNRRYSNAPPPPSKLRRFLLPHDQSPLLLYLGSIKNENDKKLRIRLELDETTQKTFPLTEKLFMIKKMGKEDCWMGKKAKYCLWKTRGASPVFCRWNWNTRASRH